MSADAMMIYGYNLPFDVRQANRDSVAVLRKEYLDIYNRLHSIKEDVSFVNHVYRCYPDFQLLPNLRCGAWYTDPALASDAHAYLKSTDGHTGSWGFNLKRANLHLLPLIAEECGIILVDSTRAGKRVPDALSKTVLIRCAVVNRAILIRCHRSRHCDQFSDWDIELYTPPGVVSAQEYHQVAEKLGGWMEALADSSFDLPLDLRAPLRPFWITPSTTAFPVLSKNSESLRFLPIICVSASKRVDTSTERRVAGYAYAQGSGDGHELWGMGVTLQLFWKHCQELISSPRAELEDLIKHILSPPSSPPSSLSPTSLEMPPVTPIQKVNGRILLASFSSSDLDTLFASLRSKATNDPQAAYIVVDFSPPLTNSGETVIDRPPSTDPTSTRNVLHIHATPKAKARPGAHFLQNILSTTIPFIRSHLSSNPSSTVCVFEGCGGVPGTRLDLSVGVGVVAVQMFFDHDGEWLEDGEGRRAADRRPIRIHLEWIIESEPRAKPSRATLKCVNESLLTPLVTSHTSKVSADRQFSNHTESLRG